MFQGNHTDKEERIKESSHTNRFREGNVFRSALAILGVTLCIIVALALYFYFRYSSGMFGLF